MKRHLVAICALLLAAVSPWAAIAQPALPAASDALPTPIYYLNKPNATDILVRCKFQPPAPAPPAVKFMRWNSRLDSGNPDVTSMQPQTAGQPQKGWVDTGLTRDNEYVYRCAACSDASGTNCGAASAGQWTRHSTEWPVRQLSAFGGTDEGPYYDVLSGFNEVLSYGTSQHGPGLLKTLVYATGYHDGLDLNAPHGLSSLKEGGVLAPRSGMVTEEDLQTTSSIDDGTVTVGIVIGVAPDNRPIWELDMFSHIATVGAGNGTVNPKLKPGEIIRAGEPVGEIGRGHFPSAQANHVHWGIYEVTGTSTMPNGGNASSSVSRFNPLRLFQGKNHLLDPNEAWPGFEDENNDGRFAIFRRHVPGVAVSESYTYGLPLPWSNDPKDPKPTQAGQAGDPGTPPPLSGDIDIAVEVVDNQGKDPGVAPRKLGYWIEGMRPGDDVSGSEDPYILFDLDSGYFGGDVSLSGWQRPLVSCNWVSDISDSANAGCPMAGNHNLCFSPNPVDLPNMPQRCAKTDIQRGGGYFPAPVLHHFIVTHASGNTGSAGDIKIDEFWNTDAQVSTPEEPHPTPSTRANRSDVIYDAKRATKAYFRDGDYLLHVNVNDLVNKDRDRLVPRRARDPQNDPLVMRLENYPPFIEEVSIGQSSDENDLTAFASEFRSHCGNILYEYEYEGIPHDYPGKWHRSKSRRTAPAARGGAIFCVRIQFSEGIDHLSPDADFSVALKAVDGWSAEEVASSASATLAASGWSTLYSTDDEWRGVFVLPANDEMVIAEPLSSSLIGVALEVVAHDRPRREDPYEPNSDIVSRPLDVDDNGKDEAGAKDVHHLVLNDDNTPTTDLGVRLGRALDEL